MNELLKQVMVCREKAESLRANKKWAEAAKAYEALAKAWIAAAGIATSAAARAERLAESDKALEMLKRPIELDGYTIKAPIVSLIQKSQQGSTAQIAVTIHEGRNRQVRRMCDAAGMSVSRLVRTQEGNLKLGNVPPGKWRYLTDDEVSTLRG